MKMKKKRNKKNFNPFKLWGSYVGAIIFILLAYLIKMYYEISHNLFFFNNSFIIPYFVSVIVGFGTGYVIHGLIIFWRKK